MIKIFLSLVGIAGVLISCDRSRDGNSSNANSESIPKVRRLERPSIENQGTRGRLRAAMESAKELKTPEERLSAVTKVGRDALESAPDIVAEAIRELPLESPEASELIQACVANLMKRSPDEALAWAESLKNNLWISLARDYVFTQLAESEPERATELLMSSALATPMSDQVLEHVLQRWTAKSPAEAADWLSKLPTGESRNLGIKTIVPQWFQSNPGDASSWVASLPDLNVRRDSIRFMAESLQDLPPFIRDSMLGHAEPGIRSEIEHLIEQQRPSQDDGIVPDMLK